MSEDRKDGGLPLEPTALPDNRDPGNPDCEALASGLQPGGMVPAGGPGALVGSIGTGGASNADRDTGDADENTIEESVR